MEFQFAWGTLGISAIEETAAAVLQVFYGKKISLKF